MSAGMMRALALAVGLVAIALAATSVVLIAITPGLDPLKGWGFVGYDAAFAVVFAIVGLLVTMRRTRNIVGWLFLASALLSGVQTVLDSYGEYAVAVGAPGGQVAYWVAGWIWLPAISLIAGTLMLFPDGRPPSPRWRVIIRALIPVTALVTFLWAVAQPSDEDIPASVRGGTLDPLGLGPDHPLETIAGLSMLLLTAALIAAAVSLGVRMRRGDATERQQIKWVLYAGALVGPSLAASVATTLITTDPAVAKATQLLAIGSVLLIPIAAAVAILRYRLYDIDVLINRTLVYGAVTALLAAIYFGAVVVIQALLRPFTAGSELAVAGSTLLVVALFQPLRRRVQDAVDRRFYRSRYDAARTLDEFSAGLRNEVELDAVRADLLGAVDETVQPAHASVWLRGAGG